MARRILQQAAEASPTIVRMPIELESSDLIVRIETAHLPRFLRGDARVVAATPVVRYLRVRLNVPNGDDELVTVLGHEHIRPTRKVAWCITVPTGTAKMEIPVESWQLTAVSHAEHLTATEEVGTDLVVREGL